MSSSGWIKTVTLITTNWTRKYVLTDLYDRRMPWIMHIAKFSSNELRLKNGEKIILKSGVKYEYTGIHLSNNSMITIDNTVSDYDKCHKGASNSNGSILIHCHGDIVLNKRSMIKINAFSGRRCLYSGQIGGDIKIQCDGNFINNGIISCDGGKGMDDYDYVTIGCDPGDGGNISLVVRGNFINNYKYAKISCKCGVHIKIGYNDCGFDPYWMVYAFETHRYDGTDGIITINGNQYIRDYTIKDYLCFE